MARSARGSLRAAPRRGLTSPDQVHTHPRPRGHPPQPASHQDTPQKSERSGDHAPGHPQQHPPPIPARNDHAIYTVDRGLGPAGPRRRQRAHSPHAGPIWLARQRQRWRACCRKWPSILRPHPEALQDHGQGRACGARRCAIPSGPWTVILVRDSGGAYRMDGQGPGTGPGSVAGWCSNRPALWRTAGNTPSATPHVTARPGH